MVTLTYDSAIRWDDWVPQERLRKFTEENRELAATLRREAEAALRQRKGSSKKRGGSDRSSARGSEERQSSVPARGTKRNRDYELEKVCPLSVLQVSNASSFTPPQFSVPPPPLSFATCHFSSRINRASQQRNSISAFDVATLPSRHR